MARYRDNRRAVTFPGKLTRRLVDLSHPIEDGMITHPGLPGPEIGEYMTREASRAHYARGTEFSIGQISMIGGTGTYLDSPFHRFADGLDLAQLPLEATTDLEGLVVRLAGSSSRAIDVPALEAHAVRGRAVLIHTGWDRHWRTPAYGEPSPFVTRAAAEWLVAQGAVLVGIDSVNIDDRSDPTRPAHTTLLGGGVPIVEQLRGLEELPDTGFRFHAAPSPVAGFSSWPVRAYAVVAEG